jgi:hypothetical protein
MRSIRPSNDLENLWAFLGVTMKVLRVLGFKGLDQMAPVKPPTLYIDRKLYFLETPRIAMNFLLLGSLQGGGSSCTPAPSLRKNKGQGAAAP